VPKRQDGFAWSRLAADEQALAERRRKLIERAQARAKDVTLDGRTYKLVRLPPELEA
jgi:hypothetical protein